MKCSFGRQTGWGGRDHGRLPALQAVRNRFLRRQISILALAIRGGHLSRAGIADDLIHTTDTANTKALAGKRVSRCAKVKEFATALLLQNAFDGGGIRVARRDSREIGYNRDARGFLLRSRFGVPRAG